tara:strand:+ start:138 stop:467 length:330 start_codon:yes stop_codon:yes gene_type:complete
MFEISYILNLINTILLNEKIYNFVIICKEKEYYVKDKYNNFKYINDVNFLQGYYRRFKQLLNTFLLFEKNKDDPISIYLNTLKYSDNNIDINLLHSLQIQYCLNKDYFK